MKVAFIGAQGVGKTSLCKALQKQVPSSVIVRETVRECPYPCDQGADFKTEWWVLSHSILAEQEVREAKTQLVITDRCLLDIAVYSKLIHESKDGRMTDLQRKMIDETIVHWLQEDPYDHMFFVKVKPDIWKTRDLNDGFRSVDLGWYQILTKEFEMALERFQVNRLTKLHVIENDGSFDRSVTDVTRILNGGVSADLR